MPPDQLLPNEAEAALRRFRRFYGELAAVKNALRAGNESMLLGGPAPKADDREDTVLQAVRLRLRNAIAAQGFGAAAQRGARTIDAGYVMAAIADEELLHETVQWKGRSAWQETPLEAVLYRSRVAGDRIFEIAEGLAGARTQDASELAMTILLALEMGFRGRYFSGDPHGEIPKVKELLRRIIFHNQDPGAIEFLTLTTGAAGPMRRREPERLPPLRPWALAIGGVIGAYLLISWMIWRSQVSTVLDTARAAATAFQSLPQNP